MSLTKLERRLRDHPLDFLKEYSVSPCDGYYSHLANRGNVNVSGTDFEHRVTAKTANKIGYGKLTKLTRTPEKTNYNNRIMQQHLQKPGAVFLDVKLEHELTQNPSEYLPFYWLPWRSGSGGIIETSLIVPPARKGQKAPPDPSLFFTAALSGCSVFVRGSRQHPTVYHAGAAGKPPGKPGEAWRKLLGEVSPPKEYKDKHFSEVNTTDYMHLPKKGRIHQDVIDYGEYLEKNQKEQITVEHINTWGCVFGIRKDDNWTFYFQQNVGIDYWVMRRTKYLKRHVKAETTMRTVHRPMYVTKFYPGRCHVHINDFTRIGIK
jgi:hypothetical protein